MSVNGDGMHAALGHRLDLAQPRAGQLGEMARLGHRVGVARPARLDRAPARVGDLQPRLSTWSRSPTVVASSDSRAPALVTSEQESGRLCRASKPDCLPSLS